MARVSPKQVDIHTALRTFLIGFLPSGVDVIVGQENRVAEPSDDDFVVMWPIRRDRLATNIDRYVDCKFVGAIVGTALTVATVDLGSISIGNNLFGVGVLVGTHITEQVSGPPGGAGVYKVDKAQTITSEVLASGEADLMQETEVTYQLDVHGPNSADNAQMITTVFRDDYAVEQFADNNADISPLYADNARQVPFLNAEQQYEWRWVIEACMQVNATTVLPQQFADTVVVSLKDVDVVFPPS